MKHIVLILLIISVFFNACNAEEYNFVSIENLIEQEIGRMIIPDIYKKLGIHVNITPVPGKRAQFLAASGAKDGEIMRIWTYGEENPATIRVPTPYYYLETMAFIKKNSGVEINSQEDLRKYKLVKVRGVKHTDNITEGMPKVYDIGNTEMMMNFLKAGRADVALTNTTDGLQMLKKLGFTDIVPIGKPLAVLNLYNYIHEKHKNIIPKVDTMIKEMKASGELKALINKAENAVIGHL